MTIDRLWRLSLFFLFGSFISGRFAIFTNGGNGNGRWYLLFWFLCTNLFLASGWMLAKSLQLPEKFTILLVGFLTFVGFVSSSPLGLMTLLGLPVLIPFGVFVVILLLIVKAKTRLK